VQELEATQLQDGEVMMIPKDLGLLVTSKAAVLPMHRYPNICQQFLMITMGDLVTKDDLKLDMRNLIRSNYKHQLCTYIQSRLMVVDLTYNYHNVEILKMISSLWVWDNVVPYMAESVYKHHNMFRVRLLP
jgi:hypothetical protein